MLSRWLAVTKAGSSTSDQPSQGTVDSWDARTSHPEMGRCLKARMTSRPGPVRRPPNPVRAVELNEFRRSTSKTTTARMGKQGVQAKPKMLLRSRGRYRPPARLQPHPRPKRIFCDRLMRTPSRALEPRPVV